VNTVITYIEYYYIVMQVKGTVGQKTTGMVLNFNATTEEEFVDLKLLFDMLGPQDPVSAAQNLLASKPVSYTNISVSYNPELSTAKAVKITAAYGKCSVLRHCQFL
jgi:hypothetical protein